jgi:hypothetical protein
VTLLILYVAKAHRRVNKPKICQVLTRVGLVATKWEFHIVSPYLFLGIVLFVKQVALQSFALSFSLYTYIGIPNG